MLSPFDVDGLSTNSIVVNSIQRIQSLQTSNLAGSPHFNCAAIAAKVAGASGRFPVARPQTGAALIAPIPGG